MAKVGELVAPVQLMFVPALSISKCTVVDAAPIELASNTASSCGRGVRPAPPVPPLPKNQLPAVDQVLVPVVVVNQYCVAAVVNVIPELPPALPEPPVMADRSVATEAVMSRKSALANVPELIVMVRAVPSTLDIMNIRLVVEFPDTVLPFKSKKFPFNVKVVIFDAIKDRLSPSVVVPAERIIEGISLPPVVNVPATDKIIWEAISGV